MKTDADYEAEAMAQYDADQAAMALVELPPEVMNWIAGMRDQFVKLARSCGAKDEGDMYRINPAAYRAYTGLKFNFETIRDECRWAVVQHEKGMADLRTAISATQKTKPSLTVIDGGQSPKRRRKSIKPRTA
jgi:hypothetical protein